MKLKAESSVGEIVLIFTWIESMGRAQHTYGWEVSLRTIALNSIWNFGESTIDTRYGRR